MQARARELEDEVSRFGADSANRITVSARNYIMTRVFELVSLCSDMRADAATERGAALALQGQLVDARLEIAGLQRQVFVAERPLVGDVLGGLAAVPAAVGPAAPVFPGAPGAEAAMGAASMGPAVLGGPTDVVCVCVASFGSGLMQCVYALGGRCPGYICAALCQIKEFLLGYRLLLCSLTAGASGAVPFVLRASRPTHDTTFWRRGGESAFIRP
ncbi:hypothetical protein MTO96_043714 [Rhipicephalus appendiculatus]